MPYLLSSSQPKMNPGYPQGQGYPGGAQQGGYQVGYQGAPQGYPGGQPPPAGAYQGGPPPAGAYQGGPQPQGPYPGAPPPAGAYQGGAPASGGDIQVQWKGEVPEQDVDDNPNAMPAQPTAPPLEKMDTVAGYGNVGFDSGKT